jgi:hypothetical protein
MKPICDAFANAYLKKVAEARTAPKKTSTVRTEYPFGILRGQRDPGRILTHENQNVAANEKISRKAVPTNRRWSESVHPQ